MASKSKNLGSESGKDKKHMYNAVGAPEAAEAMDETPGMKKGGRAKKKMKKGGHVEGHKGKHRADHKARGGKTHEHHKRASGGRTPYTSGHDTSEPSEAGKTSMGHESERPG